MALLRPLAIVLVITALSWATLTAPRAAADEPRTAPADSGILNSSASGSPSGHPIIADTVRAFYAHRAHGHAWIHDDELTPAARALIGRVANAQRDGLPPLRSLPRLVDSLLRARELDRLDVFLTEVFAGYGLLLAWGQVSPQVIHPDWRVGLTPAPDLRGSLIAAMAAGDVDRALDDLAPRTPAYHRLREALGRYLDIEAAGGWEVVPGGRLLKVGDTDARVPGLRDRLRKEGDLVTQGTGDVYDDELAAAVRRFQARHGLPEDGVLGPITLAALNVPIATRVRQIVLNLERHRWLPALAPRRLSVNVLGERLTAIDNDRQVLRMRVVMNGPSRSVPGVATRLTSVVVDRQRPASSGMEFRFLAQSGGCVPETPAPELQAFLEGGCLYVEDPVALAAFALADDVRWHREDIERVVATGEHRRIELRPPLPVYLLYWTAWADADDGVSFREDRDGFDERLTLALMGLR